MAAARWLFTKPVDPAALASLGLGPGSVDTATPELWPCVAQPVAVLAALNTQWRLSMGGRRVGLDYAALPVTLRLLNVPRAEWPLMFADLQLLEHAALEAMST
jgi:hypothetical protein